MRENVEETSTTSRGLAARTKVRSPVMADRRGVKARTLTARRADIPNATPDPPRTWWGFPSPGKGLVHWAGLAVLATVGLYHVVPRALPLGLLSATSISTTWSYGPRSVLHRGLRFQDFLSASPISLAKNQ